MKEVGELATSGHEEADTRLVIHAKHAAANHPTVTEISEDTEQNKPYCVFIGHPYGELCQFS